MRSGIVVVAQPAASVTTAASMSFPACFPIAVMTIRILYV
jgi:hypothetical protein